MSYDNMSNALISVSHLPGSRHGLPALTWWTSFSSNRVAGDFVSGAPLGHGLGRHSFHPDVHERLLGYFQAVDLTPDEGIAGA